MSEKNLLLMSWVPLDSSSWAYPRDRSVLFRPPQFSPVRFQGAHQTSSFKLRTSGQFPLKGFRPEPAVQYSPHVSSTKLVALRFRLMTLFLLFLPRVICSTASMPMSRSSRDGSSRSLGGSVGTSTGGRPLGLDVKSS